MQLGFLIDHRRCMSERTATRRAIGQQMAD